MGTQAGCGKFVSSQIKNSYLLIIEDKTRSYMSMFFSYYCPFVAVHTSVFELGGHVENSVRNKTNLFMMLT